MTARFSPRRERRGRAPGSIVVTGNNQTSVVGKTLALPLVVKVTDSFGNNVSGVKVTWTPGNLSGTVIPPQDSTGADGNGLDLVDAWKHRLDPSCLSEHLGTSSDRVHRDGLG